MILCAAFYNLQMSRFYEKTLLLGQYAQFCWRGGEIVLCVFPNSVSYGLIYMLVHADTIVSCSFVRSSTSLVRRGKLVGLECFAGVKMLILVTHAPYRYFDSRLRNETMMFNETVARSPIVTSTRVELFGVWPMCNGTARFKDLSTACQW